MKTVAQVLADDNAKVIHTNKGEPILVDADDFEKLKDYQWYQLKGYAYRVVKDATKTRTMIKMHREILGFPDYYIDHVNRNKSDNRKSNLRACSTSENNANRIKQSATSSIYKGVCWENKTQNWLAFIGYEGKTIRLGRYETERDAAEAYNRFADKLYGQFALLNKFEDDHNLRKVRPKVKKYRVVYSGDWGSWDISIGKYASLADFNKQELNGYKGIELIRATEELCDE